MELETLRKQLLSKRTSLTAEQVKEKSLLMTEDVISSPLYQENDIIYLYIPSNNELDTNYLITKALQDGKAVALPYVMSSFDMVFIKINDEPSLKKNRYGILEPYYNPKNVIDGKGLMIVPIVGFKGLKRVGFGHQYYNNYLLNRNHIYTLGVAYDFQEIKEDVFTEHDVPLSEIRTY